MLSVVSLIIFSIAWIPFETSAFTVPTRAILHNFQQRRRRSQQLWAAGDPVRAATGIRPSLHPVTINAIAEALRQRASGKPLRDVAPLEIVQVAGTIAIEAIVQRQKSSAQDGMQLTPEEEQTIAGRVVGVVVRFDELEGVLREKCQSVGWIAKYQEWSSFGLLDEEDAKAVDEHILRDPLICMNRAECLLALFLSRVEAPSLLQSKQEVPGGSAVDFIDSDRREVLVEDYQ